MKTIREILQIVIILLCLSPLLNAQERTELKVGETVPNLLISKWLRGEPVSKFNKKDKRIYVLYFTGTWCSSCVKSIPHLTKLQKKYEDFITLIGIYMEKSDSNDTSINRVINLMEALDKKMDFTIAVDQPGSSRAAWGLKGPAMFIIQSGKILWRGSSSELDPVLEQLADGTFDPVLAQYEQQSYKELLKSINKARTGGNFKSALTGIERLIKEAEDYPERLSYLYRQKFEILAGNDDKSAYEWLQWLLDKRVKGFVWSDEGMYSKISLENRNYEIELKAMDRAIEESVTMDRKIYPLQLKAKLFNRMGNYQEAIEVIQEVISTAEKENLDVKKYKDLQIIYTYKALVIKDAGKGRKWLRKKIYNQKVKVDSNLIYAVMQVDSAFALELLNNAPPEIDKKLLIRYKYMSLANESGKKANVWLQEELKAGKKKIITPKLVDVVMKIPDPDYNFAIQLVNQGLYDLIEKRDAYNYHLLRGEYFVRKASIYAALEDYTQAVVASEQVITEYKEQGYSIKVIKELGLESVLREYQSKL